MCKGFLRNCAKITKKWMPAFDIELTERYSMFPESCSGWFWLEPPNAGDFTLISEVIDPKYAVLVFGDTVNDGPQNSAQTVYNAWVSGGWSKVRNLEGCFSSVILDRSNGAVVLIGDAMGRRALSYYRDGATLIVSPHDVTLAATGRVPVEFDEVSVCSVVAVEWSLRGRSLLKRVQTCHPAEYIRWSDGRIQNFSDSVINSDQRIIPEDGKAVSRNLDQMIQIGQAHAQKFSENQLEFKCDLSAGLDSRVTWSFLLSVVDEPTRIIATSCGEPNNVEVQIGYRLAKMYGTRFASFVESPPSPDDFIARCDLLAFSMNGGTDGSRAMKYPAVFAQNPKPYACGAGGEIFRGFYYPHAPYLTSLTLSPTDASQILRKRTRIDKLPWKSPEFADSVLTRLNSVIDELATFSVNGYDILDMFYLYERFGVWSAGQARQTWKDPRWSPFISSKMVRAAYLMPAPIAKFSTIHYESIRRFTPKAYWIRANGKLLIFEGEGPIKSFLKKMDNKYQGSLRRIKRVTKFGGTPSKDKDMNQLVHDFLAGPLMEIVREVVISDDSFALKIFGKHGVELLLSEQESGTKNNTGVLGFLVSMERWRAMVEGAAGDAASV